MFNRRKKRKEDKGFPCPSCMQNFLSVEEIKAHFEEHHNDQNGDVIEDQGEGFLCPVCRKSLASPEMLQSHYDAEHNEDTPVLDPSHSCNGEITGVEIKELRKKLELLQSQLRGSEESRTLLSSEVFHSEQKVSQFSLQLETLKMEKDTFKSKASQLAAEIADMKTKAEEGKGQQYSIEGDIKSLKQQLDDRAMKIKNLENQLAERPGADAIGALTQELKTTKAVMDKMAQEREKEKGELEKECKIYKVQSTIQETKVEALTAKLKEAPKLEDILRLQLSLSERESDVKSLRTSVHKLETDSAQLQDGKQKLLNQLDQLMKSASEGQATIVELREQLSNSAEEKRNLHNILLTTQNDLLEANADLAKTQNRLLQSSKLVEEHASTISHLQVAMDEKDQITSQAQQKTEKAKETNEELKNELETVKSVLNKRTKELEESLSVMGDCESSSQAVLLQKDQEISEIKFKVEKLQADLNMKSAEICDLQNELVASNKVFEDERQQSDNLKAQLMEQLARLEEEARKLSQIEEKVKDLEGKVLSLSEEKQRLENERQDLVTKIDAGEGVNELIHQMKQENSCLQEKLLSLEATLQGQASEHFSKEETLHKHLQEVRGQLQESESKMLNLESALEKKSGKLKTVQQKLGEIESDLKVKSELLLTSDAARSSQRVELEKHHKTANISLEKTTAHLTATKSQLDLADKDVAAKKDKIVKLESKLHEQKEKLFQANQKTNSLERELKDKISRLAQVEAERREMEDTVCTNNQIIVDTKGKLVKAEQDLEVERKSKTAEMIDFSKMLEKLAAEKVDLQQMCDDMSCQLVKVEAERGEMADTVCTNNQIIVDTRGKLAQAEQDLEVERRAKTDEMADLSKKLEKLAAERADLQQMFDDRYSSQAEMERKHREKDKELEDVLKDLSNTQNELKNTQESFVKERRAKTDEMADLSKKLEKLAAERADLQQMFDNMNSSQAEMERKHREKDKELEDVLKDLSKTQNELKNTQESFVKTRENCDEQLIFLTEQSEKDKRKAEEAKEELVRQVSSLTDEINSLMQDKMAALNQSTSLNQQLQQCTSERDRFKGQLEMDKLIFQADVKNLQKIIEEASAGKEEYRADVIKLKILLETEQENKQQEIVKLVAAKDLLLQHKMEIESALLELQGEAEQWTEELDKVKQEADEAQKVLQQENSALTEKLAAEVAALKRLQIEKDEFEKHSTLLGDNLTTVRSDLMTAETSLGDLSAINEHLRRDKFELQAKLDRSIDERRLLIERCASSEKKCEKLMESMTEQTCKMDDIQAALHELGRENQTLQITTTKVQGRKWADDTEATECMSCDKAFSVIIRKHHCRHCGHIFCQECSSRTAHTPSVKKSVRVCDTCYRELQVHRK